MARREFGRIDRLPSGRYRARYTAPDGARHAAPSTFTSKRDAGDWLARARVTLTSGHRASLLPSSEPLGPYLTGYLDRAAARLRPRTLDLYRRTAARWILRPVGTGAERVDLAAVPLGNLTPALVRTWHAAVTTEAHAAAEGGPAAGSAARDARAWARSQGWDVAPSGRLAARVVNGWEAAGRPSAAGPTRERTGASAVAQAYRLLRAALSEAVSDGLLPANPCKVKGAATTTHPERQPLTPAEVAALAAAITPRYRVAVLVAAWSGLRPGEVFALRRSDLDLTSTSPHLTVRRTLVEVPGHPVTTGPPKSTAGRRTVTLPETTADALRAHLDQYTAPGPDALVFTTPSNTPVTATRRSRALRTARETIGRPDLTWHHLRHTGATLAAIAGATQAELQRRIGHSTTRAAAIYQHARDDRDQWIAAQLNTLASPTPPAPTPPAPAPEPTPPPSPARPARHLQLIRSA